eukprot:6342629-Karenia_brevis.AAC.1
MVSHLEATIACPTFTGLITYHMEDPTHGHPRGKGNCHLLGNPPSQPMGPVAVRGNVFSFMLPWDQLMSESSDAWRQRLSTVATRSGYLL